MRVLNSANQQTGPDPLSEHALSHVLSEVLDNFAPTDEDEIRISLREAGYRFHEITQVMKAWGDYWEKTIQCSICGAKATCRWGDWNLETGEVMSMVGVNKLAPSCDQCAGRVDGQTVILGSLELETLGPISPKSVDTYTRSTLDQLAGMLNKFDHEQINRDRPFLTCRVGESVGPLERVQRMIEWIHNLREVPPR